MRSTADGDFAAAWFDSEDFLWDDERLGLSGSLAKEWVAPRLVLNRPEDGATAVLFNPNAIAVSAGLRDALSTFGELEFLEILIEGHGSFFIVHVLAAIELPIAANARFSPPKNGNLVELRSFPETFDPPPGFFRVLHPTGSPARKAGFTTKPMYAGPAAKIAIERLASQFLEARPK